jgi:DNA-binding response OmpR family regulator
VLVAEDDPGIARALELRLRTAGFEVEVATDGAEALRLHRTAPADAIVLDVRMPVLDGFEVLECLGPEAASRTPIVLLTAQHSERVTRRAAAHGVSLVMKKPYRAAELVGLLTKAIDARDQPAASEAKAIGDA